MIIWSGLLSLHKCRLDGIDMLMLSAKILYQPVFLCLRLINNSLFQIEKGDIAKSKGFPDTFTQDLGYDWEL